MNLEITSKASKQIVKLPMDIQVKIQRVVAEIEQAKTIKNISNIAPIKNHTGLYRIKLPSYRIIVERDKDILTIRSIIKRDERTYKNL